MRAAVEVAQDLHWNPARLIGTALLYLGDYREATASFESVLMPDRNEGSIRATLLASQDSVLLADAAAAFYGYASSGGSNRYYSLALSATERALKLDQQNVSATFTRGLIFERLELRDDARAIWKKYLQGNLAAGWFEEATAHLRALDALPQANLEGAGDLHNVNPVLAEAAHSNAAVFAAAIVAEGIGVSWAQSRESSILAALESAAGAVERTTGDPSARETLEFVRRSPSSTVATAFSSYARASAEYKALQISSAEEDLDASIAVFSRANCPALYAALVQKSGCRFYDNDVRGSLSIAEDVLRRIPSRYHHTRGQALWLAGLCQVLMGRSRLALQSYDQARDEFVATGDIASLSGIETLQAELYQYLGDEDSATINRRGALRDGYLSANPLRISMALSEGGTAAMERGDLEEAGVILRRLVILSREHEDPLAIVDALMSSAQLEAGLNGSVEAARLFASAFDVANRQTDREVRERLLATIALRAGESGAQPLASDWTIGQAIDFFIRSSNQFSLASALLVRGKASSLQGRSAEAEADFRRAMALVDDQLFSIRDPIMRARYLEKRQAFCDALVAHLFQKERVEDALRQADDAHESLLDTYRNHATRRPRERSSISSASSRTAFLEFFVSGDTVYGWSIADGSVRGWIVRASAQSLERLVERLGEQMAMTPNGSGVTRRLLRRLDELLVDPAIPFLGATTTLVVVPDRFLDGIPYAGLLAPDGRYRVETLSISTDVSMRRHADRQSVTVAPPDDIAILGIGGRFGKNQPDLPEVSRELKFLAGLYPSATVRTSVRDHAELIDLVGRHSVAHIATHGFADRLRPLSSGIRLGETASLTAAEIATSRFPSTRLVFLGICEGSAPGSRRTAVGNVSTAFLAAGVPAVIGSLWNVRDTDARAVAEAFHRQLRSGKRPSEALRAAQLSLLRSRSTTDTLGWASFVLTGS
jgi:CHAT domain-containing protein